MNKKGLGKGLEALIESENIDVNGIIELGINEIEPNSNQPRKYFDDERLFQLADSIKQHGIVQPIIVQKEADIYRIVAGERRWRAAKIAGLKKLPVIIKNFSSKQYVEIALIENIQREDLNPIEEAEAYERLINEFEMTQDQVAKTIGKSRPAIANAIRLLSLNEKIKDFVATGRLSNGHARALIAVSDIEIRNKIAEEVIKENLNVRDTEKIVQRILKKPKKPKKKELSCELVDIQDKLKNILGTKVKLVTGNKKGRIIIEYYSNEELERILEIMNRLK